MMAYSHVMIGIASYIAMGEPIAIVPLLAVGLGSLLPDADHQHATINKMIPPLKLVTHFTTHRGITHSLLAIFLLVGVAIITGSSIAHGIAWGYTAHIMADMLTVSGVRLLTPLSDKNIRIAWLRTNGNSEHIIIMACGLYITWAIIVWAGYDSLTIDLAMDANWQITTNSK